MLRLALIENLRRVAVARRARPRATATSPARWADRMIEVAEQRPEEPDPGHRRHGALEPADDAARSSPSSRAACRARAPRWRLPLTWIEQRLAERGLTIEQLVQAREPAAGRRPGLDQQQHRQPALARRDRLARVRRDAERRRAACCATIRRASMPQMDFATRDRYRHVVEQIAREVARDRSRGRAPRRRDWRGTRSATPTHRPRGARRLLPDRRTACPTLREALRLQRRSRADARAQPVPFPVVPRCVARRRASCSRCRRCSHCRAATRRCGWLVAAAFCADRCASQLAVALVNWLATLLSPPRPLPRMDFRDGIPPHARTLVVVPTMLGERKWTRSTWSRRSRCASSPIATSTSTSRC